MITKAQRAQSNDKASTKTRPIPSHSHPNHLIKKDLRPLVTASLAIMIVVHSTEVSTLYRRIVISSLIGWLENLLFTILTLPLVYDLEITTCRYIGLLQEWVMLCYDFPVTRVPACSTKVSSWLELSYPVPRKRERSLHTCVQDVQITRMATIW
jgi:hypothetical protein